MKPFSSDVLIWDHRGWQINEGKGERMKTYIRILSESSHRRAEYRSLQCNCSPALISCAHTFYPPILRCL